MKYFINKCAYLIFIFLNNVNGITQIIENFENNDFSKWYQSKENHWGIISDLPIQGKYTLKHIYDNDDSDTDQISLDIGILDLSLGITKWRFQICYGYNPSSSNNWSIFLVSDEDAGNMTPEGTANGYVLGVNFTGSDDCLKLWKKENRISLHPSSVQILTRNSRIPRSLSFAKCPHLMMESPMESGMTISI